MVDTLQQIIDHLDQHSNHSISIEYNGRRKMNPYVATNRYLFTKKHIISGWTAIASFFKSLKSEEFPSGTKVYLRVPNGTTTKIIGEPITLQFSSDEKKNSMNREGETPQQLESQSFDMQNHQLPSYYGMGSGVVGVHPAASRLDAMSSKYDDIKERYSDLKSEYKDLRSMVRQLKEENNSLKLEVNTAEKQKELAILQANLSQKSFMDSEAMKTIAANLAPALPQMISGQTPQIGMGVSAKLSSEKRQFMEFISNENIQDADVNFMYKVYKHALRNKDFAASVQELFEQFKIM